MKYVDDRFEENFTEQEEDIQRLFKKFKIFKTLNVKEMAPKVVKKQLSLLKIALNEAEKIYDEIYWRCPKCGGEIDFTTEETPNYPSNRRHPQAPTSFDIWRVRKCKKCETTYEKEHITTVDI